MKTTRISRTICLLLACLVLLPLVACGKSEETPEATTEAPVGEATTSAGGDAVTENTDNADALYDRFHLEPVDLGEEEVTLLYWSDRKISPALYEVALKLKYSQDDVSAKMFDIAKSSVVFDLGRILSNALSGPASTWQKAITGSVSWTTTIKAQEKPWNKQLEKMLQVFE